MNIRKTGASASELGDTACRIAEALRPVELTSTQRGVLQQRVLQRARDVAPEGTHTRRSAGADWVRIAPHVETRLLSIDIAAGVHISLLRLGAGGVIPEHRHSKDEEFVVLEGQCHVGNHLLMAGDIHRAAAGSVHGPITTRSSVLVYLRGEYPYPR